MRTPYLRTCPEQPSPRERPFPPEAPEFDSILGKFLRGGQARTIARELALPRRRIKRTIASPEFLKAVERIDRGVALRLQRGEFGVAAFAKMEAPSAFRRIVTQSKKAKDERVQFQANKEIIAHAGIHPPKPRTGFTVDDLIEKMTIPELEHFHLTGEIPARFKGHVAQLEAPTPMRPGDAETVEGELEAAEQMEEAEEVDEDAMGSRE